MTDKTRPNTPLPYLQAMKRYPTYAAAIAPLIADADKKTLRRAMRVSGLNSRFASVQKMRDALGQEPCRATYTFLAGQQSKPHSA
jgi:hypothetical protein